MYARNVRCVDYACVTVCMLRGVMLCNVCVLCGKCVMRVRNVCCVRPHVYVCIKICNGCTYVHVCYVFCMYVMCVQVRLVCMYVWLCVL